MHKLTQHQSEERVAFVAEFGFDLQLWIWRQTAAFVGVELKKRVLSKAQEVIKKHKLKSDTDYIKQ